MINNKKLVKINWINSKVIIDDSELTKGQEIMFDAIFSNSNIMIIF